MARSEAWEWELTVLRRRRRWLPLGLPAASFLLLIVLLVADLGGERCGEIWRGERALTGERRYVPSHPSDPDALARVDLALLHERLLPRWSLGLGWGRRSTEEREAFGAAFAEASQDPNLGDLLLELREVARTDAAGGNGRVEYLTWAWNTYLERLGARWHMECNVEVGEGRNGILIRTYAVDRRTSARVGRRQIPTLVLERADHLDLDDDALGRTGLHDGSAQVLKSGVREHAILRVWPLLHELSANASFTDGRFAKDVSAEVRAALEPAHFAALTRTAPACRALLMMRDAIHEREECGSRLRLGWPGVRGYSAQLRARLVALAEAEQESPCPAITLDEAATIASESRALEQAPDLDPALDALTRHLIRGVAIHEARHVADEARARAFRRPLRCMTCPAGLGAVPRAELSAYLASFADEATGVSSLHQACRVADNRHANAVALGFLLPELVPEGCTGGPPPDLQERARALERALFGRSEPTELALE